MKYLPGLLDPFISPITGKLRSFAQIPSFDSPNYIIIGDAQGNPIQSPALIDVKLDIIELRTILDKLVELGFIIEEPDILLPNAQALNQLINGFLYNTNGVLSIQTPGSGNLSLQKDYVYVGDDNNVAQGEPTIKFVNLPDIPEKQIIMGDSSDRPQTVGLTHKKIFRGNSLNLIEESDALTDAESSISQTLQDLANLANVVNTLANTVNALSSAVDAIETGLASIGGFAAIILLQAQVLGLIGAVSGLSSRVDDLESSVSTIQNQISTIQGQIGDIYSQLTILSQRLDNLRLNHIPADGDVSFYNYKLINLNSDEVEQTDGLNAKFLWDLMHDNVGVVWA